MEFERIFLGDLTWLTVLEILIRTVVLFLYTLVLFRLVGKRGLGQLSPFELLIIVALGSAVGDPMFYPDVPVLSGMIVITAVVGLERLLVLLTESNRSIEKAIESSPVCVVADGELVEENLDKEDLSRAEIEMLLRLQGVENLGDVRRAYLEPTGRVSVFWSPSKQGSGDSILPGD
ncbi:MAG TPA: YetF domain-containing protein [Acidimicrobiia bacterium]|nr:YetF domain-containing protein [Acidimicrobiia bacterium]